MTEGFEVGQTVMFIPRHRGEAREATVEKVGRTLVHVRTSSWGEPDKFYMDTGSGHGDFPIGRIATVEQYAEERARSEVHRRLRQDHGVTFDHFKAKGYRTTTLAAVLDLLDAEAAR